MNLSDRLRELRKSKKVTQKQMSEILNLKSDRTYRQYEAGEIEPPIAKVIVLADYFDVSVDYLLGRTDYPYVYTYEREEQLIGKARETISSFHKLLEEIPKINNAIDNILKPD